jgi:hypothetical protein
VIFGDTPEDMRPDHLGECRALVRELGLTEWVIFAGFRPDVRAYVADFDVAVVPSVYEDPLPRAVMEAMAMSKPVIAFRMGGIGEMIDDSVEGQLVTGAPPDIKGLADACLAYFDDETCDAVKVTPPGVGSKKISTPSITEPFFRPKWNGLFPSTKDRQQPSGQQTRSRLSVSKKMKTARATTACRQAGNPAVGQRRL